MILLAALSAAALVYLAVGLVAGVSPGFNRFGPTTRSRRSGAGFQEWLNQAGVSVTPAQFVAVSLGSGLLFGLVVIALTGVGALGLVAALSLSALPRLVFARRKERASVERLAAWPDVLRDIAAHLRASQSIHSSLVEVGRSGPAPLRPYFARYGLLSDAINQKAALEVIREDLADPLSDRIIEIVLLAFDQGTGVVLEVLDQLADSTTADLRLLEEVETAQLETRLEARAASVLPMVVLGLLCMATPGYRAFYSTPTGWIVICFGAAMSTVGLIAIGRLGHMPDEERILAGAK